MIQINFNVQGSPGSDPVLWCIDNGLQFALSPDLSGRMIVRTDIALPSPFGSSIVWKGQQLARLLVPPDGFVGEATDPRVDMQPPSLTFQPPPPQVALPTIVGDHFELDGQRWVWRMVDGFCDHGCLFNGQVQRVRDLYKQSQDLDARGRRIFGMFVNIAGGAGLPTFDPRTDPAKALDTLDHLLDISAEFRQPLNYCVFADADLLGMDLGWCQSWWAQVCDRLRGKAFITLVNQWNHGGNLVGRPNDYPNPGGLSSQGSANEDTNPPNPTDGTGNGYQFWEWCSAVNQTHLSHEYYIWKGLSTGRAMPCVISEPGLRLEESGVDLDHERTETHASLANGCGRTVHSTAGKYSQLLGPNVAAAVKLSMSLLANGQA